MTILLNRAYQGTPAATVITLPDSIESALIAQGFATASTAASTTAGAVTVNQLAGKSAIATGAASVVITNSLVTAGSKIMAYVAQATADTTLTAVLRVVPAAGSFTIFGPANATANTLVDWVVLNSYVSPVTV
jgi:hypothetical protein